MSKITSNDLIKRFEETCTDIISEEEAQSNLNFALRDILNYLMPYYRDQETDGISLAARMLAFHVYKMEACSFDDWKY